MFLCNILPKELLEVSQKLNQKVIDFLYIQNIHDFNVMYYLCMGLFSRALINP